MKKFIICSFIFIVQLSYSQKKYQLDYALEFEKFNFERPERGIQRDYYLINAQNNSILLSLVSKDSLNFDLYFSDREKFNIIAKIKKDDFAKAEIIDNACEDVYKYSGDFEEKLKKFTLVKLNDTIIEGVSYFHYKSKSIKNKRRFDSNNIHYVIHKDTPEFLPFLPHSADFALWRKLGKIPNGLPFMIFHKNFDGEIIFKMQLINYIPINKSIMIPSDCEPEEKTVFIIKLK